MKYQLRFFVRDQQSKKHIDCECFANIKSNHFPLKDDLVFIGDKDYDNSIELPGVESGNIYKVLYTVIIYDNECKKRKDTTVEVVVKRVNK